MKGIQPMMLNNVKSLVSIALLTCALAANAEIYYPQGENNLSDIQKAPKEIAWDIHNTLVEKESSRFGKTAGEIKKYALAFTHAPLSILSGIGSYLWSKVTGKETNVALAVKDMKNLPRSADNSGEAYSSIFLQRRLPGLALFVDQIASAYKPRPGMCELVKELHEQKVPQMVASNIGPRLLVQLDEKLKNQYNCPMFDYLEEGKIVSYNGPSSNPMHASIGKPNPTFYNEFNRDYPITKGGYRIFIDDKLDNVTGATNAGWIGIHLDLSKKNSDPVKELKKDLTTLGFTVTQ